MEVAVLVDVCEAAQDLEAPLAHARLRHQLPLLLHQLVQVAVLQQPCPFEACAGSMQGAGRPLHSPPFLASLWHELLHPSGTFLARNLDSR